jgi:molybdate transport system substrate-binding protein
VEEVQPFRNRRVFAATEVPLTRSPVPPRAYASTFAKIRRIRIVDALFLLVILTLTACAPSRNDSGDKKDTALLVVVAASSRDAVNEIAKHYARETGIEIKLVNDDSSKLATQIVNGAPADLFLSANEKWGRFVQEEGFAVESKPLLGNSLVLIVPKGNRAKITTPNDLLRPEVRKVALAGPNVPAGIYARQALVHWQLWEPLDSQKKIVSGENVRVTLAYVERGEVEAGIVFGTDAKISNQVETVVVFGSGTHDKIVYPLLLLQHGAKNAGARKFYDYLQGETAAQVFEKHGFSLLGNN